MVRSGLEAFRAWYAPTTMLNRGSVLDGKSRPRAGDVCDAPVGVGDARGRKAGAWVFLGGTAQAGIGWGASTWLGPTLMGNCGTGGVACIRMVKSPPGS